MPKKMPLEDRFWEKVDKKSKDECWNWTASTNNRGYGMLANGFNGMITAHRLSWIIHFGEIPIDKLVLHKCDNKKCVNPDHLYIGTQSDNMKDKVLRNPNSSRFFKLDSEEAKEINRLYSIKNFTRRKLAKIFKCHYITIYRLLKQQEVLK